MDGFYDLWSTRRIFQHDQHDKSLCLDHLTKDLEESFVKKNEIRNPEVSEIDLVQQPSLNKLPVDCFPSQTTSKPTRAIRGAKYNDNKLYDQVWQECISMKPDYLKDIVKAIRELKFDPANNVSNGSVTTENIGSRFSHRLPGKYSQHGHKKVSNFGDQRSKIRHTNYSLGSMQVSNRKY